MDPYAYLDSLKQFGMKLGLEAMQQLVAHLDHPEQEYPTIHIGGTNGKGSTAAYLAAILQEAGYTVGLYTSPHLLQFTERIQVNGKHISEKELARLILFVKERLVDDPTYFEFATALAFQYFKEQQVDIALIEVGLGGRLDATNVITPLLSVITNIALDHVAHLGKTLQAIAQEKAGIIKEHSILVTAEQRPELLAYFKQVCKEKQTRFVPVVYDDGTYQERNKATARAVCELLRTQRFLLPDEAITKGLSVQWPGRLQNVGRFLLDGAHNLAGMQALAQSLPEQRDTLILGIAQDKDAEAMVACIVPLFKTIIVTEGAHKPMPATTLARLVQKHTSNVRVLSPEEAIAQAEGNVVVTGSLYLVGRILHVLS